MDKYLGVFITLMTSHLHVSLKSALRVITHHVTHPVHGPLGVCGHYLYGVLHRLGGISGNHFHQPNRLSDRPQHRSGATCFFA